MEKLMIAGKGNNKVPFKGEKKYCLKCNEEIPLRVVGVDKNDKKQEVFQWYQCWKCGEYYPVSMNVEKPVNPEKKTLRIP